MTHPGLILLNGVELNKEYPNTFSIPSAEDKAKVKVGDFVKIGFTHKKGSAERMWVQVTEPGKGTLDNDPVLMGGLIKYKDVVEFQPEHILDILTPEDFK